MNKEGRSKLHLNIRFRVRKGFKGRLNQTVMRQWLLDAVDGNPLPPHVEFAAVDWSHGKEVSHGSAKDVPAFAAFILARISNWEFKVDEG